MRSPTPSGSPRSCSPSRSSRRTSCRASTRSRTCSTTPTPTRSRRTVAAALRCLTTPRPDAGPAPAGPASVMLGRCSPDPTTRSPTSPGVRVGHTTRDEPGWLTGVTVVVPPPGTVGGVDVRGGGPGTRETDLLDPRNLVSAVDAVVLAGRQRVRAGRGRRRGRRGLRARVRGWPVGPGPHERVPIVPAAILFDLGRGGLLAAPPERGRRRRRLPGRRRRTGGAGLRRRRHRGADRRAARRGGHGIRGARLGRRRSGPSSSSTRSARRSVPTGCCSRAHLRSGEDLPDAGPRPGRPPTGRRWPRRPSGCARARRRRWPSWRPT